MDHRQSGNGGRALGLLSVVTPVHNEEAVLPIFRERLWAALGDLPCEVVFVDDGSTDSTPLLLRQLAEEEDRVEVVTLSRNFGHQAAITAGLDHARGDACVVLDADLQDPPELIPDLLDRWREGFDVVSAVRRSRPGDSRSKRTLSRWFYRVFSRVADVDFHIDSGDFRLLDRSALDALNTMRERTRFLRGMSAWIGFSHAEVPYERPRRPEGVSKYTPRRMVRLATDGITSFSRVPLRLATVLGLCCSLVAFLAIPVAVGMRIAGQFVPGITTVLIVVLLLGGIQLITVGIIGEYLGQVYEEVKRRPLYVLQRPDREDQPVAESAERERRAALSHGRANEP